MSFKDDVFEHGPDPDNPGWHHWNLKDETLFNGAVMGKLITRVDADGKARLRMFPERRHSNVLDAVHGGVTLALIDIAMFATMRTLLESDAAGSVTLDLSTQFIGAGMLGQPLDGVAEVLRETGRLVFLRGLVVQGEGDSHIVLSFSGTIRKASKDRG